MVPRSSSPTIIMQALTTYVHVPIQYIPRPTHNYLHELTRRCSAIKHEKHFENINKMCVMGYGRGSIPSLGQ